MSEPKPIGGDIAGIRAQGSGDEIVLREKGKGLARAFEILANLPDDFLPDGRRDAPPQEREGH
jgi:antitoxin VapB